MDNIELKKLKARLAALSVAGTMMATGVGFANADVKTDDLVAKGIKVEQDEKLNYQSQVTANKEEVEKWVEEKENALKNDYDIIEKKIIELENQVISTEKVNVKEFFSTEKSAYNRKEEIEKGDIESSNLRIERLFENSSISINETFDNKEDALEFIKQYKERYNVQLSLSEIYSDWVSNGTTLVKELSGLTEEERDSEIEKITKELDRLNTDLLKYKVVVSKTSKIEGGFAEENVVNESKSFNTLEEANNFINELKLSENEKLKFEINDPILNTIFVNSETSKIEKYFDNEEDLNLYLEKLENAGYELSDISKDMITTKDIQKIPTGKVVVSDSSKIDSSSYYEVAGNYIILKQANGNIAVWTLDEMSPLEQESFKKSWFSGNYDPSIKDDVNVYFIFGIGEKDLSYIDNPWGTYNIMMNNGKIIMTCDKSRISHINYGYYEQEYLEEEMEVTKYLLTGNKSISIYKDEYVVDYKKTEKISNEIETFGALISKEEFVRDLKYNATGSYLITSESWILSGEYIKNHRGSLYFGLINAIAKDRYIGDITDNEEVIDNEETIDNVEIIDNTQETVVPKTGDESNLAIPLSAAAASLIAGGMIIGRSRKRVLIRSRKRQ